MENREADFDEERIIDALNAMEDKMEDYLKQNNMFDNYHDYPAENLSRILFRSVLDLDNFIVIDYALKKYDLANMLERPFVGWLLEWPFYNYEDFEVLLLNRISAEERKNLNETVSAGTKNKNMERI